MRYSENAGGLGWRICGEGEGEWGWWPMVRWWVRAADISDLCGKREEDQGGDTL